MGSPLWERDDVRAAIAELLDSARAGRGGALFVEGDAGLGKSSILELAGQLAAPDLRVGLGQGDAMEISLPFGVLDQALATLGGATLVTGSQGVTARSEQLYRLLRWLETLRRVS